MKAPTTGRIVLFTVSATIASAIADERARSDGKLKGNPVQEGDVVPLVVVRVWDENTGYLNGQLVIDGNHGHWVSSVSPADFKPTPGFWHWPEIKPEAAVGTTPASALFTAISDTKQFRKSLDEVLSEIKQSSSPQLNPAARGGISFPPGYRDSRERSFAVTKIQEAIMWLGMDLKAINEEEPGASPNPYPQSYNPESSAIEPTADGLKL